MPVAAESQQFYLLWIGLVLCSAFVSGLAFKKVDFIDVSPGTGDFLNKM